MLGATWLHAERTARLGLRVVRAAGAFSPTHSVPHPRAGGPAVISAITWRTIAAMSGAVGVLISPYGNGTRSLRAHRIEGRFIQVAAHTLVLPVFESTPLPEDPP